jgi:hypothetical protein
MTGKTFKQCTVLQILSNKRYKDRRPRIVEVMNLSPSPRSTSRDRRSRTSTLAVAILVLAVLVAPSVMAQGNGPGGGGSGGGSGGPGPGGNGVNADRWISVDVEGKGAQVRSAGTGTGDELGFQLEGGGPLWVEMRYTGGEPGGEELLARIVMRDIVEFRDANANGLLDEGDEFVSFYDLGSVECQQLEYRNQTIAGDMHVHTLTARTQDGVFAVVSRIPDTPPDGPEALSNSWMKIDIGIEDFPYQDGDTQLALRTRLETQARLTIVEDSLSRDGYVAEGEGVVEFQDGGLGFYSWLPNATVDGESARIGTTVRTVEAGVEIDHVYKRGGSILHDPKLGMPSLEDVAEDVFDVMTKALPYAAGAVAGAVVVVAAVAVRRRQDGALTG